MALSNTISLLIFIISTIIIGFINCAGIKFGQEIQNGTWLSKHRISFPLTVGQKHYFFGVGEDKASKFWFIHELAEDGRPVRETSRGWNYVYNRVFPFTIDHKQFIFSISDQNNWRIQEILPGGLMGTETANGYWKSKPTIIFPFYIGGKHYLFSLTGTNWFIRELLPNGQMGLETDSGAWKFEYTLGFPFWMIGRQYFYCVKEKYWFIRELLYGGKMGEEMAAGNWTTNHALYVPFGIDDKYYFYAAINGTTDRTTSSWIVQELLPGGKMGMEKARGSWQRDFNLSFTFNIEGRQFFYGVSEYFWSVREIIQEPRLPIIDLATSRKNLCDGKKVPRRKRQNNGTCNPQCQTINASNDVLGAIEAYFVSIENDVSGGYDVCIFNNSPDPRTSPEAVFRSCLISGSPATLLATFRLLEDANHDSIVDITALIRAEIHRDHMTQQRDLIPPRIYKYLGEIDRANDDETSYLLAASLGGDTLPFNFAPRSPTMNQGATPQPSWNAVEEMLRDYLIKMPGDAYIRWTLAPIYSLLRSTNSRRPTNFWMTVQFFDAQNNLVNWRGEGAHRYFHFLNAPTEACKNPSSHSWWDWSKPN